MAEAAVNNYKIDLRALEFTLWEHLKVDQLFAHEAYAHLSRDDCQQIITQCARFAVGVSGPLNASGDRIGCRLEGGKVHTPPGFKSAWDKLWELGLPVFSMPQEAGGYGGPHAVHAIIEEMLSGANTAFQMYAGLTHGAADVIATFALPEHKARFLPAMTSGRFAGTMCLSEPHAGSDVGAAKTRAVHVQGPIYNITGTKCWISAGDHDLAQNIIHLVLARIEGAPLGTKGLSLFMVPKIWVNDDGTLGKPNDVVTGSIEHKLGIRASATAVLNFGESGNCRGILVGAQEHAGMKQMFRMMNGARISVGVQGIALASTAYLNALRYARERLQGSDVRHFKDPNAPRVAIIEHADVRRMLLDMKAKVEGMRTLAVKLAMHNDLAHALAKKDPGTANFHQGQVDLLTPIVKAYCADQSFRIAELAIQTYGGAGYVTDNPVEQYCRDAKIFSIYEGTNHIQAIDLISRKVPMQGGAAFKVYLDGIKTFVAEHHRRPGLAGEVQDLGKAAESLERAAGAIVGFFTAGKTDQVMLVANPFLEIMAEVTIAHLLLEAGVIAAGRVHRYGEEQSQADFDFYQGKVMAAKFFANFVLPAVHSKADMIVDCDRSALDIPDGGFAHAS